MTPKWVKTHRLRTAALFPLGWGVYTSTFQKAGFSLLLLYVLLIANMGEAHTSLGAEIQYPALRKPNL